MTMKKLTISGFIAERASQKGSPDFSFANARGGHSLPAGFTLIETMIAVTILTLAVAGPLTTASRAVVAGDLAHDQLTASYLAQEGVEYVHAMRDDEYLSAYRSNTTSSSCSWSSSSATVSCAAWNDFLTGADAASITQCISKSCTLDPLLSSLGMGYGVGYALNAYTAGDTLYLANGGVYTDGNPVYTERTDLGGVKTGFARTVQVFILSATEARVVSAVTWSSHGTPYTVTVTDHLTPWQ